MILPVALDGDLIVFDASVIDQSQMSEMKRRIQFSVARQKAFFVTFSREVSSSTSFGVLCFYQEDFYTTSRVPSCIMNQRVENRCQNGVTQDRNQRVSRASVITKARKKTPKNEILRFSCNERATRLSSRFGLTNFIPCGISHHILPRQRHSSLLNANHKYLFLPFTSKHTPVTDNHYATSLCNF